MKKYHLLCDILAFIIILIAIPQSIYAKSDTDSPGPFAKEPWMAMLGITTELAYDREDNFNLGGYLSFKYGFWYLVALYGSADLGYRSHDKTINLNIGLEAYLLYIGLQFGSCIAFKTISSDTPVDAGLYIRASVLFPSYKFYPFLFLGCQIFFTDYSYELSAGISLMLNIFDFR